MSQQQRRDPGIAPFGVKLGELLGRLAREPAGAVNLSLAELAEWPAADVAALKAADVLRPGNPAREVQCPGCERACFVEVEVVQRAGRAPALFIVCDQRDDMGLVPVDAVALERWGATRGAVARLLARLLGGDDVVPADETSDGVRIGVVPGESATRAAALTWNGGCARLHIAGHELELALVLTVRQGVLALDMRQLARCVNAPAGGKPAEEPEQRRLRFVALLDAERRVRLHGCLQRAAARAGENIEVFKKVVYRAPKVANAMQQTARTLRQHPKAR